MKNNLKTDDSYRENYIKEKVKQSIDELIKTIAQDIRGEEYVMDNDDKEDIDTYINYIYDAIDTMDYKYLKKDKI